MTREEEFRTGSWSFDLSQQPPKVSRRANRALRVVRQTGNLFRMGDRVRIVAPQGHPLWHADEDWRKHLDGREAIVIALAQPTVKHRYGRCRIDVGVDEGFRFLNVDVRLLVMATPVKAKKVREVDAQQTLESSGVEALDRVKL